MTDRPATGGPATGGPAPGAPAVRRLGRRRVVSGAAAPGEGPQDRVAEPSQTRDDTDEGWSESPEAQRDAWLRAQRPPHWD